MKKLLFIVTFVLIQNILFAQDSTRNINLIVKTDILEPLLSLDKSFRVGHLFSLSAEKILKKRSSLQLTFSFGWNNLTYNTNLKTENINENAFFILPIYKLYISKRHSLKGFYLGAFLFYSIDNEKENSIMTSFMYITNYTSSYEYTKHYYGFGPVVGYQLFAFKRISFDVMLYGGFSQMFYYKIKKEENVKFELESTYNPFFYINGMINMGYKFL